MVDPGGFATPVQNAQKLIELRCLSLALQGQSFPRLPVVPVTMFQLRYGSRLPAAIGLSYTSSGFNQFPDMRQSTKDWTSTQTASRRSLLKCLLLLAIVLRGPDRLGTHAATTNCLVTPCRNYFGPMRKITHAREGAPRSCEAPRARWFEVLRPVRIRPPWADTTITRVS